ncbi:hypothetical protein D9V96_020370 [Zobellia laminariae]|uniref:hypothetical protein n=1 Tax=Zobellia laminariae TaxID=248906 RepID=UPI0012D96196
MKNDSLWLAFASICIAVLNLLLTHVGKEKMQQFLLRLGESKHLKTFQYILLYAFVPLILFLSLIVYTILIERNEIYQAVVAFMLLTLSGLFFAFMNYKLFQK